MGRHLYTESEESPGFPIVKAAWLDAAYLGNIYVKKGHCPSGKRENLNYKAVRHIQQLLFV